MNLGALLPAAATKKNSGSRTKSLYLVFAALLFLAIYIPYEHKAKIVNQVLEQESARIATLSASTH